MDSPSSAPAALPSSPGLATAPVPTPAPAAPTVWRSGVARSRPPPPSPLGLLPPAAPAATKSPLPLTITPTPHEPQTPPYSDHDDDADAESAAAATSDESVSSGDEDDGAPLAPPPLPPFLSSPKSFHASRAGRLALPDVPRQTVLKALASSRRAPDLPLADMTLSSAPLTVASAMLSPANSSAIAPKPAPAAVSALLSNCAAAAALPALQSPCFYHQRFEGAVDVPRLLEEVAADSDSDGAYTSHSRLVQTALGVREVARQLQKRTCKMAVNSVMIVTKARDNALVSLTREVAGWLMRTPRYGRSHGVTVYVDKKLRNSKRFDADGLIAEQPNKFADMLRYWTPELCWSEPERFDLVLTLGGDGTVLYTSWLFQRVVPPILSFSLGSLGFLTGFEFGRYRETLTRVLEKGMRVNMRMRFTCTVYRAENGVGVEKEQFEVLNELVIDRGPSPYVSNLELYGDDAPLTVVQADGCIISTPTGSTAYSLSAGGSLVHPDIPAILLTPICAHTLNFRPMLLTDSMLLRVCIPATSRATAYASFDGKGRIELKRGDAVTIEASQYPFPTVLSAESEWIDSISRTLRWNTRGAQQKGWGADGMAMGEQDDEQQEVWDIDTDSGVYNSDSEEGSEGLSPVGRKMALLGM